MQEREDFKMNISFQYPYFLFLLFLVPLFIIIYFLSMLYNRKKSIVFSNFKALERISNVEIFSKGFSILYINLAILILLVFAMSGANISFSAETSSFSYVIVIDNSQSMNTADIFPSRLDAAKDLSKDFVNTLPIGVKVGVIQFSGDAIVIQKLDNNKLKTRLALESVESGDNPGTNVHAAIISADKLLENEKMKSVILISDGQFNSYSSEQVSDYAVKNNIIINSIMVGTEAGGETEFNTTSTASEYDLKALALITEGVFFKVSDAGSLDKPLSVLLNNTVREVSLDISVYSLFAALVLFLLHWILYNFRFRTIP